MKMHNNNKKTEIVVTPTKAKKKKKQFKIANRKLEMNFIIKFSNNFISFCVDAVENVGKFCAPFTKLCPKADIQRIKNLRRY